MSVEVSAGRLRTHGSATSAEPTPSSAATRATASITVQSVSVGPSIRRVRRLAHLARSIRWIRGHYNETLRVEQLAALATMSVSSFHRHFRAVASMTPIQFQKEIRLREARARLIAEPGDVAGAGFAVGYDSPSQFSREYRRMFGVPPSRDALALRDAAVLPSI
jgi:transcriptional regulator GlxA family with amidase domain